MVKLDQAAKQGEKKATVTIAVIASPLSVLDP